MNVAEPTARPSGMPQLLSSATLEGGSSGATRQRLERACAGLRRTEKLSVVAYLPPQPPDEEVAAKAVREKRGLAGREDRPTCPVPGQVRLWACGGLERLKNAAKRAVGKTRSAVRTELRFR